MGTWARIGQMHHQTVFRAVVCLAVTGLVAGVIPAGTAEARSEVSQSVSVTINVDWGVRRLIEICLDEECETFVVPSGADNLTLVLDYTVVDGSRLPRVDIAGGTPDACTGSGPWGSAVARPGAAIDVSRALLGTNPSIRVSASGEPVTTAGKRSKPQGETTDAVGARICLLGSTS